MPVNPTKIQGKPPTPFARVLAGENDDDTEPHAVVGGGMGSATGRSSLEGIGLKAARRQTGTATNPHGKDLPGEPMKSGLTQLRAQHAHPGASIILMLTRNARWLVDSDDDDEPVSLPKPALLSPKLRRKTPQRLVDSDDDDEPSPRPKPKARRGARQRKQKQTEVDGDGEGSEIEHENEAATDADAEGYPYKSGPVPQGAKDRLLKAQDDLTQIVEQMAVELNKPAHLLWQGPEPAISSTSASKAEDIR
ncbi:hypothetical protein B0H14DRAFT_3453170 [Mycena olivaceomarginata]|nr:hypothetical protein B0H14DRAFT_3453170 [Mycena olivaceomarginata]